MTPKFYREFNESARGNLEKDEGLGLTQPFARLKSALWALRADFAPAGKKIVFPRRRKGSELARP